MKIDMDTLAQAYTLCIHINDGELVDCSIRKLEDDNGVYYWCAADVANALGYKNANSMIQSHCICNIVKYNVGANELIFINELDLNNLILRSNKPEAVAFRKWVCGEIIPSLFHNQEYIFREITAPEDDDA